MESGSYNEAYVRRLLPGQRVVLLTVAHRRLGLMVRPDRAARVDGLHSLAAGGLRFANRQPGSGTRVWLDSQLAALGIDPANIAGYDYTLATHTAVAQAVAAGQADAGLGVETAALAFGLHYQHLARERYDLVIPEANWHGGGVQAMAQWLASEAGKQTIRVVGRLRHQRNRHSPLGGVAVARGHPNALPRKPQGQPTRGKTAPNRLRRVDNFLTLYDPGCFAARTGLSPIRCTSIWATAPIR